MVAKKVGRQAGWANDTTGSVTSWAGIDRVEAKRCLGRSSSSQDGRNQHEQRRRRRHSSSSAAAAVAAFDRSMFCRQTDTFTTHACRPAVLEHSFSFLSRVPYRTTPMIDTHFDQKGRWLPNQIVRVSTDSHLLKTVAPLPLVDG